ncbi:MAG: hypothetical protein G01um101472_216 [Parcubacteria group bacterium Gr01-1014_72]|nr:MAG: hypothetical protein G01um101472_216 [Parcubacteria group bacterium Gr01-1014_72]
MNIIARFVVGAVGIGILLYLVTRVEWGAFLDSARDIRWGYLPLVYGLYAISNIFRALRARLFLPDAPFRNIFGIIGVQNAGNTFLPLRAGEFSYVYLVHQGGIGHIGANISSLLAGRVLDLLAICVIFALSLLLLPTTALPAPIFQSIFWSVLVLTAVILCSIGLARWLAALVRTFSERFHRHPRTERLLLLCADILTTLTDRRLLASLFVHSLGIWGMMFGAGALLLFVVGVPLAPASAAVAYAFPVFVSLTPLITFGGFGPYEGALTFILLSFGVPEAVAIPASFILHILELLFVAFFGLVSVWLLRSKAQNLAK